MDPLPLRFEGAVPPRSPSYEFRRVHDALSGERVSGQGWLGVRENAAAIRCSYGEPIARLLGIGLGVIVLGGVTAALNGTDLIDSLVLVAAGLLGVALAVLVELRTMAEESSHSPVCRGEHRVEISETGFRISGSWGELVTGPGSLKRVVELEDLVVLTHAEGTGYPIPRSWFASERDYRRFIELAQRLVLPSRL
jgi:hypothetical protein